MHLRTHRQAVCEQTVKTHITAHTDTGTQQEEAEVVAKEVGDEWALSKQHSGQEVPIGRFAWRKEVWLVCERMSKCGGGVDVTPWVQLTLNPQHSAVDPCLGLYWYQKQHMSFTG